jgi:hypothetical protein
MKGIRANPNRGTNEYGLLGHNLRAVQ